MFSLKFFHQFLYQYFSIKKGNKFLIGEKAFFFSVLSMWKKSKQTLHNISWNWEILVGKIGENIWWTDQKIVNGDKQKKKGQKKSEFSCILKFLLQYQEILLNNYYYTTIYILTSKTSLHNCAIKAPFVGWE